MSFGSMTVLFGMFLLLLKGLLALGCYVGCHRMLIFMLCAYSMPLCILVFDAIGITATGLRSLATGLGSLATVQTWLCTIIRRWQWLAIILAVSLGDTAALVLYLSMVSCLHCTTLALCRTLSVLYVACIDFQGLLSTQHHILLCLFSFIAPLFPPKATRILLTCLAMSIRTKTDGE